MAETINERIADRTERADEHLKEQGFFGRIMNRIGLRAANGVDRVESVADNNTSAFLGGTLFGAMRGSVLGTVAWAGLVAIGVTSLASLGGFLAVAGAAAFGFGLYHGQKAVEHHAAHSQHKRIADHIAEKSGATLDKRLTDPILEPGEEQSKDSHVARENARRRSASSAERGV
jgi:hypothetical protein